MGDECCKKQKSTEKTETSVKMQFFDFSHLKNKLKRNIIPLND